MRPAAPAGATGAFLAVIGSRDSFHNRSPEIIQQAFGAPMGIQNEKTPSPSGGRGWEAWPIWVIVVMPGGSWNSGEIRCGGQAYAWPPHRISPNLFDLRDFFINLSMY